MERKIGEIFEHNGEWYQCVEQPKDYVGNVCKICSITELGNCELGICSCMERSDDKSVIFKKLEKLGEPYVAYGKVRQKYKLYVPLIITNSIIERDILCDDVNEIVDIEIKQDKEDMEENRLKQGVSTDIVNGINHGIELMNGGFTDCAPNDKKVDLKLKPFDIEAAKTGKPVCTRDGRKARIICFDAKGMHQPIIALITQDNGVEYIETYYSNGRFNDDINSQSDYDLMMLPEKKEG